MRITKPLLLAAAVLTAAAARLRRRQAQVEADALWREATADASQ